MTGTSALVTTLAHTATPAIAQGHHQWWRKWREAVGSLRPAWREAVGPERECGVTHVMESAGAVRVGARLIEPPGTATCGVVQLHGYHAAGDLDDRTPWSDDGAVTLKLRVRGFPGSRRDTGDWCSAEGGWIAQGLALAETSAVVGAVADVVLALRAFSERLGGAPVGVRGDSFGGGLAVIAAANALEGAPVWRLAIGAPSLGDWTPRLLHPSAVGAGADAGRALEAAGGDMGRVRRTLRLTDAAVHARRVQCPALCLLAIDDPVVPPHSAAAVFNALGSDPGQKRRIVVARGHEGLTTEDLRRVAAFERLAARFLSARSNSCEVLSSQLEL